MTCNHLLKIPANFPVQLELTLMKMKLPAFWCVVATLFLALSFPALALINPEEANQPVPDWMTRIYVVDKYSGDSYLFCYGALTDKEWVMSAGGCFFDVYHTLEFAAGNDEPEFFVTIGASNTHISVDDYYFSDDGQLVMFQLSKEVNNHPLKLTSATVSELINQKVRILGKQESLPAGDPFFNPLGGRYVSCAINGKLFFNAGTMCHIFTYPQLASTLQQTNATIIDPKSTTAPATSLDKAVRFDSKGAQIYLDFRQQNSYPCLEDIGLPVIRTNASGETEMVGIVSATGLVAGVPMCTPSLVNKTLAVNYYKDFIEKTMIAGDFNKQCPVAPKLSVTYTGENGIRLEWDPVNKADGYQLQYSSRVGYVPFETVDMYNKRTISTSIDPSLQYTVAVMAYNSNCNSQLSEPLTVSIK